MVFLHKTYSQHDYSREKLKIKQKKKNLQFRNKKEAVFPQPLDLFATKSTPGYARGIGKLLARKKVDKKKAP